MELKPEIERLVQEEISRGHFHSVDEVIEKAVYALREKHQVAPPVSKPRTRLYDLLTRPPFAGSELTIERQQDHPRTTDLG